MDQQLVIAVMSGDRFLHIFLKSLSFSLSFNGKYVQYFQSVGGIFVGIGCILYESGDEFEFFRGMFEGLEFCIEFTIVGFQWI